MLGGVFINYYDKIKNELIKNEITKKIKDYSKNKSDLDTYYNVGKLLSEAGKRYGESIIKDFSVKLSNDLGKKYNERTLRRMRQYYNVFYDTKWSTVSTELTWSHYVELLDLKKEQISYYIKITKQNNLSVRELRAKIKSNEYERLPEKTKLKLVTKEKVHIEDFVKNPIIIKNNLNTNNISEKMLKIIILEDIDNFLNELGDGFTYVGNEYKIKIGGFYNYIDILLFNYKFNSFVVVELKTIKLKKEHIGQIQIYMNYIDKNIKTISQNKTIGLIIVKNNNELLLEYSSDSRIFETSFILN